MKIPKNTAVRAGGGIPCPRCNTPAQEREHKTLRIKQLKAPYYYSRWYRCLNPDCQTKIFNFEEDKVFRDGRPPRPPKPKPIFPTGEKKEEVWGPSTYSGPPPWED